MQLAVVPHSSPLASNQACYFRLFLFLDVYGKEESMPHQFCILTSCHMVLTGSIVKR